MANIPSPVPEASRPPRFTGRLVIGLAVIGVGVLFLLNAFNVPGIEDVWRSLERYWPLLLILIGITKLANACSTNDRFAGGLWIAGGALLLAHSLHYLTFDVWNVIWPLLLILWGARMVGRGLGARRFGGGIDTGARTHAIALMSGVVRKQSTNDYRGGEATALMGGCEIDLRQCDITHGPAVFDAFALMGGIELRIPGDWSVRNEGVAILGGIEDSRKETAGNPGKELVLRGTAIMGGVEIKN